MLSILLAKYSEEQGCTPREVISGFKDGEGRTIVHFAANFGQGRVVKYLCSLAPEYVYDNVN